jgi:hypothetical protein
VPLPCPAPRAQVHTRDVICCGYRRTDGLWDVEARMTDRKAYAVCNDHRTVEAGAPFHDMALRVTIDDGLLIHAVDTSVDAAPHQICPVVTPNFKCLVGLRIGAGFGAELRRRLSGVRGCTHLVELFGPLATTAIQTVRPLRREFSGADVEPRPVQIDTCHALAAAGQVVARYWPRFHHRTRE